MYWQTVKIISLYYLTHRRLLDEIRAFNFVYLTFYPLRALSPAKRHVSGNAHLEIKGKFFFIIYQS